MRHPSRAPHLLFAALALTACAAAPVAPTARAPAAPAIAVGEPSPGAPPTYAAIAADPDRTAEDRALDWSRHPAELLAFLQVRPGMRVAELGAAEGYTAELLARAVGPRGTVYAQNTRTLVLMMDQAWPRRLARPAMRNVVRVDREFVDPLPPEAKGLDLVVMNATYHDLVWLDVDRARMNQRLFEALRPGGALVVIDSSAKPGAGREAPYELHRIEASWVRREVEAAGFRLAAEGDFLRNPADTLDWSAAPNEAGERRGTSDRYALRFVRP